MTAAETLTTVVLFVRVAVSLRDALDRATEERRRDGAGRRWSRADEVRRRLQDSLNPKTKKP